jgi:KUP system potassium uptake protein
MRADNRGEGGILALVALVTSLKGTFQKNHYGLFVVLGILGVALLYSDGVISAFFGPIIIVWFIAISAIGLGAIVKHPAILVSLNPYYAINFLLHDRTHAFGVLGSVFLAVTGAEVLYADMGHFGARPIRLSWFWIVFPSLLLNYMGQGAFLLTLPKSVQNLFYLIVPAKLLYPMVVLATLAAIIASQAVISGAFSLARQSVQLGFLPRLHILHTSRSSIGQVYVPFVNWTIMTGVIILVIMFRESSNLGAAYGIAVATTMLITGMLIVFVARGKWHTPWSLLVPLAAVFFIVDGTFFASNILKIKAGGWIVLLMACAHISAS